MESNSTSSYTPLKTRVDILKETGIPIQFVEITIVPYRQKKPKWEEQKCRLVYKKRKFNDNEDIYLMSRIRTLVTLSPKEEFIIKNKVTIKEMGYGKYEA